MSANDKITTAIRAIIVEDDPRHADALSETLALLQVPVKLLDVCTNIEQSVASINRFNPDMVFLDIDLDGGESGFDILKRFENPAFSVIFITQHSTKGDNLDKLNTCGVPYFPKPVKPSELTETLHHHNQARGLEQITSLQANLESETTGPTYIHIPSTNGSTRIATNNIIRCESENSYTHFYLNQPVHGQLHFLSCDSLKDWERRLARSSIMRVHNEFMVNIDFVEQYKTCIDGTARLVLHNREIVRVSKARKKALKDRLKT